MKNLIAILFILFIASLGVNAQKVNWPKASIIAKPGARWWWMGSAVDTLNLDYNLKEYSSSGMGTMEITPIYGVEGNEAMEIPFLSKKWMDMYKYTYEKAKDLGMQIDMNTGTGWPFGGENVKIQDAASKLLISEYNVKGGKSKKLKISVDDAKQKDVAKLERLMAFSSYGEVRDLTLEVKEGELKVKLPKGSWHIIAAFCGKTLQKVKRAAPGGDGYVLDHFSRSAVTNYLSGFTKAFKDEQAPSPHLFFNDSYEVYGADWTSGLFDEFYRLRGYKLEEHLEEFLSQERNEETSRIISDYRETLSELLLENFTRQWTQWAHSLSSGTRNQAHGSPGNLIDLYAEVDVPECEGFGLSEFNIKGLRKDSLCHPNYSDLSMLKYASSAAHITGKPYTSSETFTWLTEHFRTSLSQCKPDLDLMFVSGVNHMFFHGTTYSPKDDPWPGWKFYASIDMSPTNSIWKSAKAFFDYITRCQSFLQYGWADNDFLLYLPIYDMWYEQTGRLLMFDIHKMAERAPSFIEAVNRITTLGYDVDYISDRYLQKTKVKDKCLVTSGGKKYSAIIIPGVKFMKEETVQKLMELSSLGAKIIFLDRYPSSPPGYYNIEERKLKFSEMIDSIKNSSSGILFGSDYQEILSKIDVRAERLKKDFSLSYIRRGNDSGHHYFISALTDKDNDGWIPLSVKAKSAVLYNPLNGELGKIPVRENETGIDVYLQLKSGQSAIIKTFESEDVNEKEYAFYEPKAEALNLDEKWEFSFLESEPKVQINKMDVSLGSWTSLDVENASSTMGTALYSIKFNIKEKADEFLLSLGDVRESAKLRINGKDVGDLWSVPYECYIGEFLNIGKENLLEVEVTNLPANRISKMDRDGIPWRKFKEINIVTIDYKKEDYSSWQPMESGLLGPVKITPMKKINF